MLKKLDQNGVAAIVLAIVVVFIALGTVGAWVFIQSQQSELEQQSQESQAANEAELTQDYPSLWGDLPKYPNATITKKRQGRNLNEGVQLNFQTNDDKATIKAFYDTELANQGFIVPTTPDLDEMTYFGIYKKDDTKQFTLQITQDDDDNSFNNVLVKYVEL